MPIYTILALAQLGLTIGLTVAGLMQVRASVFLFGFVMALSISLIALVMLAAKRHSTVAIGNEDAARRAKAFLVDNAFVSVGQAVLAVSMAYGLMQPMAGAPYTGVISVFRESSTEFPRPGLTSGSAAVRGIPKVFECGAGLDRLDEPSRPPPLAGPGVAGSVAVRY
jgi:hypothetical protein